MHRSSLLFRSTALVLSWAMTATSAWAVDPSLQAAPTREAATKASASPAPTGTPQAGPGVGRQSSAPGATPKGASSTPPSAPECTRTLFGPQRYDRTTGPPNEYTNIIKVPADAPGPFVLRVTNGAPSGQQRVSSARITLDGTLVVRPSDLNQNVPFLWKTVTLRRPQSTLQVRLTSAPGSYLTIEVCQTSAPTDTTPPVLTLIEPKPDAIVKPPVALWLIYQDNQALNLSSLVVKIDTRVVTGLTVEADKATGTAGPLADGLHVIDAEIRDQAGNPASVKAAFMVDGTPPQLDISEPLEGQVVTGTSLTVAGQVHDVHATTVMVENVPALVDCHGTTGGTCSFRAENMPLGTGPQVTLRITAEDVANNVTTKTVRVNRDGTAPSVHISTPAEGAIVRGPSVTVTGTASDDGGGPVTVEVNGQAATVSGGAFTAQVTATDGPLTLEAVARDAANNSATDSVRVTVDSAPPVIEVTEPVVRTVNGTSVRVAGTVRDASSVTLTLDGQPVALPGEAFATDVALGAEGPRVLRLEAVDAAGNRGSIEVPLTIDRTPPTLTLIEPVAGAVVGGLPVVVRGTVGDAVGPVAVLVNGVPATVVQGGFEARLEGLGEGALALSVAARDAAGNTAGTERTVTLDLSAPVLTLSAPANGTLTGAASVVVAGMIYDVGRASVSVAGMPAAVSWDDCCSGTFSASVPLAEGDNTLVVEARDPLDRTATASRLVTRDSLAPAVELSVPERVVRGRTGQAVATVTDASSITGVVFLLDGVEIARLSAPPYAATFQAPANAANGQTLTLVAHATDAVGHVGTASRAVRVAGGGVVVGQVLADDTGLPLSGADVRLFVDGQPTAQAVSDARGRYSFAVEADEAVVSVVKAGFTSVLRPMVVQAGVGTVAVDARLMVLAAPVVATEGGVTLTAPLRVRVPAAPPSGASASVVAAVEPTALGVEALVARRLAKGRNAVGADLSIEVPAGATLAGTELSLTSLSPQGLPGLLPLGWSPLAAFDLRASAALVGPLDLHASGLAQTGGVVHLVAFDPSLRAWKLVQTDVPVTSGAVSAVVPGAGAYALVSLDEGALTADTPPVPFALPAPGAVLPSAALVWVPTTATATGLVEPAVLPPAGGTATGSITVTSPAGLPSGTLVQAEVSETYRLASGQTATEDRRLQDLLLYRQPAPAGVSVATTFPITPTRSFDAVELASGTVHLVVKSGREGVRGAAGGSDAVEVTNGDARLSVPSGALPQNTAVSVAAGPVGAWLPSSGDVTALAQLEVDLAGAALTTSAELSVSASALAGPIAATDTLLLARVERVQGVPRLMVVALAALVGEHLVSRPYAGLAGVRTGGAYVFVRVAVPVGFAAGTTTAVGAPVRALLTTSTLPFIGLAGLDGRYIVAARAEANAVTASVPGTSLATSANATVAAGETVTLDLALAGTVTAAVVRPPDGTQGVAPTVQVEIEAPTALDPGTITADTVRLIQLDATGAAVGVVLTRRVLSASRRVLAIVPEHALDYSTAYRVEVNGLADAQQGLVTVPPATFRTKDFAPPQYDLTRIVITVPDANGLAHVSAESGTLAPGTRVLILNAGNGIVVTFTADNDGALTGEFPATVEDRLFITITDPQGNLTNFERSTYFDPATGFTAVSTGGGVIAGPGGVELRIPDGALDHAVRLKLAGVPIADVAEADKPADPYATLGGALRIESSEPVTFAKEVDVSFPKPADAPDSAEVVYWIQRRVTPPGPGGALIVFETLDRAKVEGSKVVTASFPFRGYRDSLTGISALGGPLAGTLDLLFLSWQIPVAITQPLPGAITGRVLRAKWGSSATAPQYEPVTDATIVGKDASGEAFFDNGVPFARTATDGTYTLLDRHYSGGPFTVTAQSNGQKVTAQGYQVGEAESLNISPLMRGFNVARVNVLLPALGPPPPTPQVRVRLFKLVEGERVEITNGLVEADTPLVIGLTPVQVPNQPGLEIRGDGAEIQGQTLSVVPDPVRQARPSDPTANTYVAQDGTRPDGLYVPANAGTYTLRVTALKLTSPPELVEVRYAFRVVAAGGGVETDPDHAPAVREAATVPRREARGVPVTVLPQIAFTEPVRGVKSAVMLEEVEGGASIAVRVLGVGPAGPIADVTDADVVTAITLQPLAGLRFDAAYRLRVGVGVTDLDPTPKALAEAYETTFRTFAPEGIPDTNAPLAIAGLAVSGDRAYVAETRHIGGIGAPLSVQSGWLNVFDVSDPTEARLVGGPELITQPPQDVAYADGVVAVTTFPQTMYELVDTGGTGTGTYSHQIRSSPANVYLYDVEADAPRWVGAVSLTQGLLDGVPQRTVVRGGQVYAASGRKGVQVVPIDAARAAFAAPPAPGEIASAAHRAMLRELGLQGTGFGLEHVVTIPVLDMQDRPVTVVDLKAADVPCEGTTRRLVLATAQNDPQRPDVGLAVVDPGAGQVAKRLRVEFEGDVLFSGSAIGYGEVNGKPLAVVGGLATGPAGTQSRVFVVDLSPLSATPAGEPLVLGKVDLAASERASDVLVTPDGLAIAATTGGTAVLVSLAQPASPRRVGELAGVGSRIGLTDAGILLSTARTFTTGSTDPLRGLHATTLERITLIREVKENPVVLDWGHRTVESQRIRYRSIPKPQDVQVSEIQLLWGDTVATRIAAPLDENGAGEITLPEGTQYPTAQHAARVRLVVNPGDTNAARPQSKLLRGERFDLLPDQLDVLEVGQDLVEAAAVNPALMTRLSKDPSARLPALRWEGPGVLNPVQSAMGLSEPNGVYSVEMLPMGVAGHNGRLRLLKGNTIMAQTSDITLTPGAPALLTGRLEATPPPTAPPATDVLVVIPADGRSLVTFRLSDVRDAGGNIVPTGTPVAWALEGEDGELMNSQGSILVGGEASVQYRAGTEPGDVTLRVVAGTGELAPVKLFTVRQAALDVEIEDTWPTVTAHVSSAGGPPADGTSTFWWVQRGTMLAQSETSGGVAVGRWTNQGIVERPGTPVARWLAGFVTVGRGRGTFRHDTQRAAPSLGELLIRLNRERIVVNTPGNAGVDDLPFHSQATAEVLGGAPGETRRLTLGSTRFPNAVPVAAFAMDEIIDGGASDVMGGPTASVASDVAVDQSDPAHAAGVYSFRGRGLALSDGPALVLGTSFGFNLWVRFDALSADQVVLQRAGSYRLSLTSVAGGPRLMFNVWQDGQARSVISGQVLQTGVFYQVAAHLKDGRLALAVGSGDAVALGDSVQAVDASSAPLLVGDGLMGAIDELAVYSFTDAPMLVFGNGQTEADVLFDADGRAEVQIVGSASGAGSALRASAPRVLPLGLFGARLGIVPVRPFTTPEPSGPGQRLEPFDLNAWAQGIFKESVEECADGIGSGEDESFAGVGCDLSAGLLPGVGAYQTLRDAYVAGRNFSQGKRSAGTYVKATFALIGLAALAVPGARAVRNTYAKARAAVVGVEGEARLAREALKRVTRIVEHDTGQTESALARVLADDLADGDTRQAALRLLGICGGSLRAAPTQAASGTPCEGLSWAGTELLEEMAGRYGTYEGQQALIRAAAQAYLRLGREGVERMLAALRAVPGLKLGDEALEGLAIYITHAKGPNRLATVWEEMTSAAYHGLPEPQAQAAAERLFGMLKRGDDLIVRAMVNAPTAELRGEIQRQWHNFIARGAGTNAQRVSTQGFFHALEQVLKEVPESIRAIDARFGGYIGRPDLIVSEAGELIHKEYKAIKLGNTLSKHDRSQVRRNADAVLRRVRAVDPDPTTFRHRVEVELQRTVYVFRGAPRPDLEAQLQRELDLALPDNLKGSSGQVALRLKVEYAPTTGVWPF